MAHKKRSSWSLCLTAWLAPAATVGCLASVGCFAPPASVLTNANDAGTTTPDTDAMTTGSSSAPVSPGSLTDPFDADTTTLGSGDSTEGIESTDATGTTTTATTGGTGTRGNATETTAVQDTCSAGDEGCICDLGAACGAGLYCGIQGLCLFEGMLAVPSGEFEMGCTILTDAQCQDDEFAQHTVDVAAFQIGRTEVSQTQYQACIAAGQCDAPAQNYDPIGTPNYPVVRVSWIMAQTYCQWQGGRLPTEAEWAKAARGADSRKYPWGNAVVNCELANYNVCGGSLAVVDSYPAGASPYGLLHMVGNVGEWVEDWYEAPFSEGFVTDPVGPAAGTWKVTRSQPYSYGNQDARASFRSNWAPSLLSGGVGMRCARDLPN